MECRLSRVKPDTSAVTECGLHARQAASRLRWRQSVYLVGQAPSPRPPHLHRAPRAQQESLPTTAERHVSCVMTVSGVVLVIPVARARQASGGKKARPYSVWRSESESE